MEKKGKQISELTDLELINALRQSLGQLEDAQAKLGAINGEIDKRNQALTAKSQKNG
jgi:hypothetical protein